MSIRSMSDATPTPSPDALSRQAFVGNIHRLFGLGYARLDARTYHAADENLLNQVLVKMLREVTEDETAPLWTSPFSIHEKQKQNDDQREGNTRLELDIVFERTGRGLHPTFKVEAKRLGPNHPVGTRLQRGTYLGPDGLGAFICCEYANDHDDAGMLGYVQSETVDAWADSLGRELGTFPGNFSIEADGTWQASGFLDGPTHTYRTRHTRTGGRGAIAIYHTLLDFRA